MDQTGCRSQRTLAFDRADAAPQPGVVALYCGCMFSGKTTALVKELRRFPAGQVLAVKPWIDRRYSETQIVTHGGVGFPARAVSAPGEILACIDDGTRLVGIDEAHFFDESLIDVVLDLREREMDVILTALDLSSWGRAFSVIEAVRQLCDEVAVIVAVCARCGRQADHTQRLTPITGGSLVGGPESYEPRCAVCWHAPPEPEP